MTAQTDLFDGLLADIVTLTNRPDLEGETSIALRTATLSAHSSAAFPRDSITQLVTLDSPAYLASIDIQLLLPRLRGLSSVRLLDATFAPLTTPEIDIVEMGDIYDINDQIKNNSAYIGGSAVNVRSSIGSYGYLVEYFQLPFVRREQYNSWIAIMQPETIIYSAAALVLNTNGNTEKASGYAKQVDKEFRPQLISNFLTSAMR